MTSLAATNQLGLAGFGEFLTPETVYALMRSTWTWDDRAPRRDLGALLVLDRIS
ncbi:hypothetical protein [[Mycobacterium] vasticus]|uniref:Uncharacterized protein n=1 Tax=[Mycobacterium] vasticus TaxID=2875777 RepID=A0ABU5Z2Q9_9MYCO|nr:hypothetical protein [Mycolicibacter sp. MYC017]MEB3071694.1 hypothetical protein [Mycolicibacter sp. MYC017]